jgi:hypothetical protein
MAAWTDIGRLRYRYYLHRLLTSSKEGGEEVVMKSATFNSGSN